MKRLASQGDYSPLGPGLRVHVIVFVSYFDLLFILPVNYRSQFNLPWRDITYLY